MPSSNLPRAARARAGGPRLRRARRQAQLVAVALLFVAVSLAAGDTWDARAGSPGVTEHVSVVADDADDAASAVGDSERAAISGDGRVVAFESLAGLTPAVDADGETPQVYVRDRDAGSTELVSVSETGRPFAWAGHLGGPATGGPSVSADGSVVAFTGTWVPPTADLELAPLAPPMVFVTNEANGAGAEDVGLAAGDGSGVIVLTDSGAADRDPALSPDGARVAFTRTSASGQDGLWMVDADGDGEPRLVAPPPPDGRWGAPAWHPSGRWLAVAARPPAGTSEDDHAGALYLVDVEQPAEPVRLTNNDEIPLDGLRHREPTWSPDGRTLAFVGRGESGAAAMSLQLLGPTGQPHPSTLATVTPSPIELAGLDVVQAAWSPTDPDRLVVTSAADHTTAALPADGSLHLVELIPSEGAPAGEATPLSTAAGDADPAWGANGTRLAFASTRPDDTAVDLFAAIWPEAGDLSLPFDVARLTTNPAGSAGVTRHPHMASAEQGARTSARARATLTRPEADLPTPTGPVQFTLCGPVDTDFCFDGGPGHRRVGLPVPPADAGDGTATATSPPTSAAVPPATFQEPGRYCWAARHHGDDAYRPVRERAGACFDVARSRLDADLDWTLEEGTEAGDELHVTLEVGGSSADAGGYVKFVHCRPGDDDAAGCARGGEAIDEPAPLSSLATGAAAEVAMPVPSEDGRHCLRAEYSGDASRQARHVSDTTAACFFVVGDEIYASSRPMGLDVDVTEGAPGAVVTASAGLPVVPLAVPGPGEVVDETVTFFRCAPDETTARGCLEGGEQVGDASPIAAGADVEAAPVELVEPGLHCFRVAYAADLAGGTEGGEFAASHTEPGACVTIAEPPPPDPTFHDAVWVRDRDAGTTTRVSVGAQGAPPDGESSQPSISADGRRVAFTSAARNLTEHEWSPSESLPPTAVYVHDLDRGETTLVSRPRTCPGAPEGLLCPLADSNQPSISADGRHVAFASTSGDLDATHPVTGEPFMPADDGLVGIGFVYVHDLATVAITVQSLADDGGRGVEPGTTVDGSSQPSISGDGQRVAFTSHGAALVDDATDVAHVYVRDRGASTTQRASVSTDGRPGDLASFEPAVSADGRTVAFASAAGNLVEGITNNELCEPDGGPTQPCGNADVFVHDLVASTTARVSVDSADQEAQLPGGAVDSRRPAVSDHGRHVAFDSDATNLAPDLAGTDRDVFVRDRTPVLVRSPGEIAFGTVVVGDESDEAVVTLSNVGSGAATVDAPTLVDGDTDDFAVTGGTCDQAILFAGEVCTIRTRFTPTAEGTRSATLRVTSSAPGEPATVTLTGEGSRALAVVTPDPLDFGEVAGGVRGGPRVATLQAVGGAPVTVATVAVAGADADRFVIDPGDDGCTGATVAPGEGCAVVVHFEPVAPGAHEARLDFVDNAEDSPRSVGLVGQAHTDDPVGELVVEPGTVDFSVVATGSTARRDVTLTNTGSAPVVVGALRVDGERADDFTVDGADCAGAVLAPAASCVAPLVFAPDRTGEHTAALRVTSDAAGAPHQADLVGLSPALEADPPVGRLGFVPRVVGEAFPSDTELELSWEPGLGSADVTTDGAGNFETYFLVLPHDRLGERDVVVRAADADGDDGYEIVAPFLVVPGRSQPGEFVHRR